MVMMMMMISSVVTRNTASMEFELLPTSVARQHTLYCGHAYIQSSRAGFDGRMQPCRGYQSILISRLAGPGSSRRRRHNCNTTLRPGQSSASRTRRSIYSCSTHTDLDLRPWSMTLNFSTMQAMVNWSWPIRTQKSMSKVSRFQT